MPATASRAVLRQSQFLTRRTAVRHASSSSEAASKASDKASSTASKASEGLSRVTSSAGPALTNAAQGLGGALKKVGGRTGKVISFVECKRKALLSRNSDLFFYMMGSLNRCNGSRGGLFWSSLAPFASLWAHILHSYTISFPVVRD